MKEFLLISDAAKQTDLLKHFKLDISGKILLVFSVIMAILLILSTLAFGGMSYCDESYKVAMGKNRRDIIVNKDGSFKMLVNNHECDENICVLAESIKSCGTIHQYVDNDKDGDCDIVLKWKSIHDPEYGVFFGINGYDICNSPI